MTFVSDNHLQNGDPLAPSQKENLEPEKPPALGQGKQQAVGGGQAYDISLDEWDNLINEIVKLINNEIIEEENEMQQNNMAEMWRSVEELYKSGDWPRVIQKLKNIIDTYSGTEPAARALSVLAMIYRRKIKDTPKFQDTMRTLIDEYPGSYDSHNHYLLVKSYRFSEQYELAVAECERFLSRFPNDSEYTPEVLYQFAHSLIGMEQDEAAVAVFDQLIARYPDHKLTPQSRKNREYVILHLSEALRH